MKSLMWIALLIVPVAAGLDAIAQSPVGSQLPPNENGCVACHGDQDLWEGDTLRLLVPMETLTEDVHWHKGVNCHDCHGGNPSSFDVAKAHATHADDAKTGVLPFRSPLSHVKRTPSRLKTQIRLCGSCHQDALETYEASVHGHGLEQSGLVVTAVCTDCHGGHGIYPASDPQSPLHVTNVAATCAKCHRFIEEQVQRSVHGREAGLGGETNEPAPGGQIKRTASCTDCHRGHDLPHPRSPAFQLGMADRCGDCHAELSTRYAKSLHGRLTELGYVPAAECSDCHGSHDILPVAEAGSRLSKVNRQETCRQCHADAGSNFLDFDPHADSHDALRSPTLYWVDRGITGLLIGVFAAFGLHTLLWFGRSLVSFRRDGRPKRPLPGTPAYVRFKPVHRVAHAVLMVSFLGLALTGLPLKYSDYGWAHTLSWLLGGFASTGLWHRIFGLANVGCLLFYFVWMLGRLVVRPLPGDGRVSRIFNSDSPIPNRRDAKDFWQMLRWFVGRGPKPTFERWTYWEKFDVCGACADTILIGSTGLILWFPTQICALLPGQTLNVAYLIHGKLALLATGFVFAIHFFNTHFRPEKFPMDMSILTGMVSVEELREERPEYYKRLKREGRLESLQSTIPSRGSSFLFALVGMFALVIGLALLVGIVLGLFA